MVTADGSLGDAWYVNDAYHGLFVKAMRLPVGKAGLYSAGTPYQGLGNDKAPYSLCERTDISSGVTAGGLTMIRRTKTASAPMLPRRASTSRPGLNTCPRMYSTIRRLPAPYR